MAENIEENWPKGLVASIAFGFILILMLATAAPNKLVDKVMVKERAWGWRCWARAIWLRWSRRRGTGTRSFS
ncbi:MULTISPECIES: hypothetical protein [Pseudomonas]|uniref:hypothetical protein n=1 Tax=Pseudomonas nitroreducens TaxID=46680 RepID=UPI001E6457B2|nr:MULTISPECIES: hypothetical protein [Pseudomonas]MCE4072335.1 hypothetical protein [Pseudomonas nitritireducens]MCE4081799.1 hypothetical protein [Pseudomonas nitroreducens]